MLMIEYFPLFSGHAVYLKSLIGKLEKAGVHSEILAADFGELPEKEVIDGIRVNRFSFSQSEGLSDFQLSLRILKSLYKYRNRYDIIHINGHLDIYGLFTLFAKISRKRIVTQMVLLGADDPLTLLSVYKFMRLRYKILTLGDAFICISKAIAESYKAAKLPTKKLHYIPQGVDINQFTPLLNLDEKELLKAKLGLSHCSKLVLFVGAVVKRKGADLLVEAWKEVQYKHPDAWLVLVGQSTFDDKDKNKRSLNEYVDKIRNEARLNNLNVLFTGVSDRTRDYYQCSDVFVLPSRSEGFGNVIIEAMACSVPVVVTYMGGVAEETVVNGYNGFIVQDKKDLSKKIIKLLDDPNLAKILGENGRKHVCRYFSLENISLEYARLYREVLSIGNERTNKRYR